MELTETKYDKIMPFYGVDYTIATINGKAGMIDLSGKPITASRVDFSLPLLLSANIGTESANKQTFLLPKPDIPDFLTQPTSDLTKSLKFTEN